MSDLARKRREIIKRYADHIESLVLSGIDFDEGEIRRAWQAEIDALEDENAS